MCSKPCLETIKVQNRQFYNLSYHTERLNRSRKALFDCKNDLDLQQILSVPTELDESIHKCRVIYDAAIQTVEFLPYKIKPIQSLQLVEANDLDYEYKYLDRSIFAHLLKKTTADDILIVKKGFLTDTSYANVVFWDGNRWYTPATPLLHGTKRQYLLDTKQIEARKLLPEDLQQFIHARLINALLDLDSSPVIPVNCIDRRWL